MTKASSNKRLQVRLVPELYKAAADCAERSGISLGSFIRLLVEDSLATQPKTVPDALVGRGDVESRLCMLAGLVASENALLALETFLPKDRWDADGLRARAIERAEGRLADVRSHLEREQL